jgi:hypothetical protein
MEPQDVLPHSKGTATAPYPEPDESNSLLHNFFLKIHSHLGLRLPSGLLLSGFRTKFRAHFSSPPCALHAPPMKVSSDVTYMCHSSVDLLGFQTMQRFTLKSVKSHAPRSYSNSMFSSVSLLEYQEVSENVWTNSAKN